MNKRGVNLDAFVDEPSSPDIAPKPPVGVDRSAARGRVSGANRRSIIIRVDEALHRRLGDIAHESKGTELGSVQAIIETAIAEFLKKRGL
jgi:hypothetical protein